MVLTLPRTSGKGAALDAGFKQACSQGFTWGIAMDGDGQHLPADLPALLAAVEKSGASLVIGNRMTNPRGMPWSRRVTNRLMSWILSKLVARDLPDTQCGLRLANLGRWPALNLRSSHFEIESEMLVAFLAAGQKVEFVPIHSVYRQGKSKIRPVKDTGRWLRWLCSARRDFAQIRRAPHA